MHTLLITILMLDSVMENRLVRDVKMMDWYAQQVAGKRRSSNNYPEGELLSRSSSF